MYNAGLPTVQVKGVKNEQLKIEYTGEGFIVTKETASLYSPGDLAVSEVPVKKYAEVSEGDVLAVFDVSGLENDLLDLQTLFKKLQSSGASMDIADTERHIKNLEERIEREREMRAPFDGVVTDVAAKPGMMAGRYTPLFEISNAELGFVIRHVIPLEYARYFNTAFIYPVFSSAKLKGAIISRTAAPDGAEVTIEIEPGMTRLQPDTLAIIEMTHITERSALVPVTAIADGMFVFKLIETEGPLGTEYRVKRIPVDVGDKAGGWAAISGDIRKGDEVVISSDRPLSDERVRLYRGD